MKKTSVTLLALLLAISPIAGAGALPSLEGLSAQELDTLRREADSRLRQMQLPDRDGYLQLIDTESYARSPQEHMGQKVRLDGSILRMDLREDGFLLALSPEANPARVFLARWQQQEGQPLLLSGDAVSVFGVFEGLSAFDKTDLLTSGLPTLQADLVTHRLAVPRLAAPPHAGTREDPARPGIKAVYEGSYWTNYASFEMEITQVSRGNEATKKTQSMSKYNITPPRHQEYFLIWMRVKALDAPGGRADIAEEDFYFVSAAGAEYRHHFLINSPSTLRNLYQGGEHTAILACLIDKDDRPLLVFQPESTSPLWFDPNASP